MLMIWIFTESGVSNMQPSYRRVKAACYATNVTMSVVGNLSPLLFLTFRSLYGFSYTQLGLLVLINFSTQLTVDLIFSFFSHRFHIPTVVRMTPVLSVIGLLVYAVYPMLAPASAYVGIVLGTVIFSASSGLAEVLISPVIAAIPSENPDREMSKLHSIYAWGVVGVVLVGTVFLWCFGKESWHLLSLLLCLIPTLATLLFWRTEIPMLPTPERASGAVAFLRRGTLWLCVAAIFFGGAAECIMAQWCSGYLERALEIPKLWGDLFGVAMFSVMLGLGRSLYAKYGRNITSVLLVSGIAATACYGIAALTSLPLLGLLACAMTGLCTAMMWPGSLMVGAEFLPTGGVFLYAMMAAGGDLGASVGPQLVGIVTDAVSTSAYLCEYASKVGLSPDQLGMKLGMLLGMLFPLIATVVYSVIMRRCQREAKKD